MLRGRHDAGVRGKKLTLYGLARVVVGRAGCGVPSGLATRFGEPIGGDRLLLPLGGGVLTGCNDWMRRWLGWLCPLPLLQISHLLPLQVLQLSEPFFFSWHVFPLVGLQAP